MTPRLITIILSLIARFAFGQPISQSEKDSIFTNAKKEFGKQYHFKEKIAPTIEFLDKQWQSGRYRNFNLVQDFLNAMSEDFIHITNDKHVRFFHHAAHQVKSNEPGVPWHLEHDKFLNDGLTDLKILSGDVGYMKIQAFGNLDEVIGAAFQFVRQTQALIIDLRGNGGGMLSNIVISYLLPEDSIHVNTIYWNHRTDSIYTHRTLKGPRYLHKPVYVLTDRGTFSSAEEFAYDLQNLKRATIVGETTGGGANPGGLMPVYTLSDGSRVDLFVSLAHVENPISKTNWEGVGVKPDVVIDPKEALKKAHLMALESIKKNEKSELLRDAYDRIIDKVK